MTISTDHLVAVGSAMNRSRVASVLFCALLAHGTAQLSRGDVRHIVSLGVFPSDIVLDADHPFHRLLVTGVTADGFEVDLTGSAQFVSDAPERVAVDTAGTVRAFEDGEARITARLDGHAASVRIVCRLAEPRNPPTFEQSILPLINRVGCNAATCHATPDGQSGFKLSVFSYDPRSDYREIVQDSRGRRVFPAMPEESLILKKPTMAIKHGGGLRFARNSASYETMHDWIQAGMPYSRPDAPTLAGVEVHPAERSYRKGAIQRLLVRARFSDGSVRDVTQLARFESRSKQFVTVDEHGLIAVGDQIGEQVVLVRYMDVVKFSRVIVPTEHRLSDEMYDALPETNFIDRHTRARWKKLGLFPSPRCSDGEFIRRASLDAIGRLPTPQETRAFLEDADPDKRSKFIDGMLADGAYADYWATMWGDLIRPNPNRLGVKYTYLLDQWIRKSLRENKPYDRFVRELITASGPSNDGTTVIIRDRRDPADMTTLVSRMFLGVRMQCARCHHHPYEQWSQEDFYRFAAYFGQVGTRGAFIGHIGEGQVKHPLTDEVMSPKPLDGAEPRIEPKEDPRVHLADWVTELDNPYFARAIVNRIWAEYFGRGIVHPVDDFRPSNPPMNVDTPCERDPASNMVQALHMMNSTELQARIAHEKGRAARLADQQDLTIGDILQELYMAAFSRYPTGEETAAASRILESHGVDRKTATEDVMWALLNSAEFVYNH